MRISNTLLVYGPCRFINNNKIIQDKVVFIIYERVIIYVCDIC